MFYVWPLYQIITNGLYAQNYGQHTIKFFIHLQNNYVLRKWLWVVENDW